MIDEQTPVPDANTGSKSRFFPRIAGIAFAALIVLVAFGIGVGTGYTLRGIKSAGPAAAQVSLPTSYTLPVRLGDLGPRLIGAGAIDYEKFVRLYKEGGQPLSEEQLKMLTQSSDKQVVIDASSARFLLNLFWAAGLTNQNRILTEGPMAKGGQQEIGSFASTGGWTLGKRTAVELYASTRLINLTAEQQAAVEAVAAAVYRPCCSNPTLFPDCNHGMAMLGLLELMASQGASKQSMLEAAKYVNAFWFPQQAHELAVFFKANKNLDFDRIEPAQLVGAEYSSGSGASRVHEWLDQNRLLEHESNGGGSCGA